LLVLRGGGVGEQAREAPLGAEVQLHGLLGHGARYGRVAAEQHAPARRVALDEPEVGVRAGFDLGGQAVRARHCVEHHRLELGSRPPQAGEVDPVLRAEVGVDDRSRDPRLRGYRLDRGGAVTGRGEEPLGDVEQLLRPHRPGHPPMPETADSGPRRSWGFADRRHGTYSYVIVTPVAGEFTLMAEERPSPPYR